MRSTEWVMLAGVVVLFLVSIGLAVAETAFVRISTPRALALAEEGRRGAARLVELLARPEQTLNVVLLCALVAQLTSAFLLGVVIDRVFGLWGALVGIVLQISLFYTFAEVAPKTWVLQHTDAAALRVAGFLSALSRIAPLRALARLYIVIANVVLPGKGIKEGPFVTEAEIKTMADLAADEAAIETEERELIHSIFEFGDTVVREVMQPRTDMVAVPSDATVDAGVTTAIEGGFSRLPVFDESQDDIVGMVILKDLVAAAAAGRGRDPVLDHAREAHFVPERKRVAELLNEMQSEKFHLALVVDEYGGTAGLVTLEDLLEEIVGEIVDEYDVEEPRVELLGDSQLRAPGRTPIDEVSDALGVDLPETEWDSVGGLLFNTLGHVPAEGEAVDFAMLRLRAERVQGRRIVSVLVSTRPVTDGAGAEATAVAAPPATPGDGRDGGDRTAG